MKTPLSLALGLILAALEAPLEAQVTSPAGQLTTEGNGSHGYVLGSLDGLRWQQVDASHRGTPRPGLREIAFRRDALLATDANFGARTLHGVTILMAHANAGAVSIELDRNYIDTPVVVFGPADVSVPDWTAMPISAPAPFDLVVPFDTTFDYNGTDDLLWEVRVQSVSPIPSTLLNLPFDFQTNGGEFERTSVGGAFLGAGCVSAGQTTQTRFVLGTEIANRGGSYVLKHSVNFGPPSTMVWTAMGFSDPDVRLPNLCAKVRTTATSIWPMGFSSPTGSVPAAVVYAPHSPGTVGLNLYLQAFAFDNTQTGLPFALTQGVRLAIPTDPAPANVVHAFGFPSPAGSDFAMVEVGGIVARFAQ